MGQGGGTGTDGSGLAPRCGKVGGTVFPEEFREKVLRRYPDDDRLQQWLLEEDPSKVMYFLDRYIHDGLVRGLDAEHVIEMLEGGHSEDLLAEAKQVVADLELYAEANSYVKRVPVPSQDDQR